MGQVNKKYVVLLSGGLDSTVNLFAAHREGGVALALTFNYGQRAFCKEVMAANRSCSELGIRHQVIDISWFKYFTKTSLVDKSASIPRGAEVSIDDLSVSEKTAERVWVPNRNGILLNIAAGFAEGLGVKYIVPGFNKEEAVTFADNSHAFMQAATMSLSYSTSNHVEVTCFTDHLNKTEIVQMGRELGVNFDNIWSCYFAGENRCGECESCLRLTRAMNS